MNYTKKFLFIMITVLTVFLYCNCSFAALYQFDDVSGTSGIGAQWVGFSNYSPILAPYPVVGPHSAGGPTTLRMIARADLISNNNSVYLQGDIYPLHTLYLVVPEGIGTLTSNFEYTGNLPAVTQGVYGGNFESSYPSIINYPTNGIGASVNVDLIVEKRTGERNVYDSSFGELIFHQNPTTVPSQSLHIPFVIANVHDGSAQYIPLEIKSTTRNTSGDIVGRRWFKWDVLSDKSVPADPVDWIFVPIENPVIDKNVFIYNFATEVTNHTGLRYGIQRYDDNRTLMPSHWKFDLQPISSRLPQILHLNPLSHIVPGLVTIYSHDAIVTVGQQKLLRLAAVDTTGVIIGSKLLELKYRTVYGYDLGSVQDTREWTNRNSFWGLNAFRIYQSNRNFFSGVLKTMEIENQSYFFPSRSADVLLGNVSNTFPPITADALSSFTLSVPVPLVNADILSKDAGGNDIWVSSEVFPDASAMLGVNVVLRIPKTNRFIAEHWDSFAASRNLANDFGRYFSIWFRSPEDYDLNVSQYLMDESKYDRTVKVFIDEENECITVSYVVLLIEEGSEGSRRRPKIRLASDITTVNDYDYILVNDGIDDGKWELTLYIAPVEATPIYPPYPPKPVVQSPDIKGDGGCSVISIPFLILIAFVFPFKKRVKIIIFSILLVFALCFASFAATPPLPELVIYESDALTSGTLRNAINRTNMGINESNIILIDNLNKINITTTLNIDVDMVIEGNGTSVFGNRSFRLFKVKNGARVHFRNMTFMNGSDTPEDSNGGAVHVSNGAEVHFDKCTFTQNVASGDGGAVYSDGLTYFTNCTFYNNSSSNGGAVFGDSSSSLSFSFVTMSTNSCFTPNGGNAVNAKGIDNIFQASIFAGNGSSGDEVVCSFISKSLGYNVFSDGSFQGTDHETDSFNNSAIDIFGSTPVFNRNDAAPGWRNWPYTLALISKIGNPAMAIIPIPYINSAGVLVDQRYIVRTGGSRPSSAGSYEVYNPEIPVSSLEIGGIPNGISTIGFTAQLRAYAMPESANPGVMWKSDDSSVVAVTIGGRVYSTGSGITLLRATSTGYDNFGKKITKTFLVKVGKEQAIMNNIPPELANMLLALNTNILEPKGVQFYLQSARNDFSDPEGFRQKYGNYPSVINPLPVDSTVSSNSSINNMGEKLALKPSVRFSVPVGSAPEIAIVPFLLSISLTAKEISNIVGNSDFSIENIFETAAFCTGANAENILIDKGVMGISVKEAENRGILSVIEDLGNVTFTLNGWFAATEIASSVVDGQLILSGRDSNGFIENEIWLTASAYRASSPEERAEGCNSWLGGGITLFLLMSLMFILRKRACKVLSFFLFAFLIFLSARTAFGDPLTADLNYSILQIVRNQPVFYMTVTVQPAASGYVYGWSTTDQNVVSLTSATTSTVGINGAGKGKAVVVCEVTSNDGVTKAYASCDVTVFETGMSGASIEPSPATLYLGFHDWLHLMPDHQPVGSEPVNFTWATDDVSIVSVDSNGNILAKSKGTATITYTAVAIPIGGGDPTSFDATCEVTVLKPVLSIDISQNPSPVMVGNHGNISAIYFPEDADSVDIVWSSNPSDLTVASIEQTSTTTAVFSAIGFHAPNYTQGQNPVKVTASSVYWKNISFVPDVSCEVVIDPVQVSGVSVTPSEVSIISCDDKVQFSHTVIPINSTKASDFWASSNSLVASVSENGLVTGLNQGQSEISYTFNGWVINEDGTHSLIPKSASSIVIVASPPSIVRVSEIEIEPTKLRLPKGASFQIIAWVSPHNAANKTIYWNSGYDLIASVNTNGLVTALNPGIVYIYADPADKGIDSTVGPAICEVTVYDDNVVTDPAFVDIPSSLQNKIEQMNSTLKLKGLEINFGFPLNKPIYEALLLYGQSPIIVPRIDESFKLEIKLAKPISDDNFEPVIGSAEFEVDVSLYRLLGLTPILPVSLKMKVARETLSTYLPDYSIEELLKNPRQYLSPLFSIFSFQKQIIDVTDQSYSVPLFYSPAVAIEAERLGIIVLKGIGDQLEFTLNYYVADSNITDANILGGSLIIGDGSANGIIRDPVWICVPKTVKKEEIDTDDTVDKGGKSERNSGCDMHPGLNIVRLIVIMLSCLIILRKMR